MFGWKALGVDTVVSLLEASEQNELDLDREGDIARRYNLNFISFPIPDRDVPSTFADSTALLEGLKSQLQSGKSVTIHCRQGVGRAGTIAASVLASMNIDPELAIRIVSGARGVPVPETPEQHQWISAAVAQRA